MGYSIFSFFSGSGFLDLGFEKSGFSNDCIWFKNGKYMPAVMEVEHTTGVTSGLTRKKGLQDAAPALMTRYVIVAPDDDRDKVVEEANRPQFLSLDTHTSLLVLAFSW